MNKKHYIRTLSIAGSDPVGGAGLQADLKTFSALGCYGMTAVTALVAEDTVSVKGVHPVPVDFVAAQIRGCLDDIGADAIKIGMLHSAELIEGVASTLKPYGIRNIVLDPVMVATSGDALLESGAVDALKGELMMMSRVITPNIPEAEILLGRRILNENEMPEAARELSQGGNVSVMLKAGHLSGKEVADVFYNAETGRHIILRSKRVDTVNTHGTGCTLSSAIAAQLAKGMDLDEAATTAKEYIAGAIAAGANYEIGHGHGPVKHFFNLWS